MGLDRLFDFVAQFWQWLVPCVVLDTYQRGVVLRLGRFHREIGPGFHWVWPLSYEQAIYDSVVTSTTNLSQQSLTTRDNQAVVVSGVITHRVRDIKTLLLEVEGKEQVMIDCAYGIIAQEVTQTDWQHLPTEKFAERVAKRVRKRAFHYGVEVLAVNFSDMQRCRSIRLWTNNSYTETPGS